MNVQDFITEINNKEKINLLSVVKKFEKKIFKCFKLYPDTIGLEDYRMSETDYTILYSIWKIIGILNNIDHYLIIMYSYYKLEDFYFPSRLFKIYNCTNIIQNTLIIKIINYFIQDNNLSLM